MTVVENVPAQAEDKQTAHKVLVAEDDSLIRMDLILSLIHI